MADKHEAILARCEAILALMVTPDGTLDSSWRDRDGLEDLPGKRGLLLDGDEIPRLSTRNHQNAQSGRLPANLVTLVPEIWFFLDTKKFIKNVGAGPAYSAMRRAALKRFFFDTELLALLDIESGGQIEYLGFETDLRNQHLMLGQMRLDIGLTYVFDPDDL